jgi:hypothetical protein
MFAGIRKLWVCMLMLALPVQATLAVTQAFCTAHQHGGAAVYAVAAANASMTAAAATTRTAVALDDGCPHAASGDASSPPQNDPASAADAPCSACAVCCAPGAIPALTQRLPVAAPAPTVFGAIDAAVEAFASGGPDRPPRRALG